ncbi:electron transfer flavoprotein subunit beta/FixA family protein [Veillonella sp. YH-vei2232]|uniref:Electron transfer flavoprotein small subunit n=1 Tax=Veillonella absiana TaxID=3079305 RepID=A0ABU3Z7U9_9FIRM|nr:MULTISPECIES: electron transfer flavoprotein subunit beta/FixA family protein [unclassified Veillonella]MDV5062565.1 electron transfer flavoprotein subunit beta/FixA family protein [Veillonella sp. YH-vei2232]MDV5087975.1 electron transfer flavoprotein subunit beta/FixA family protein [Veillonella sp. YH-vei2233]
MELLVCIKQVPDTSEIKLDPETNNLIRTGLPSIVNPFDLHALEAALVVKDAHSDSHITVISMGPPQAEDALRECLALGADDAVLITDRAFGGADTLATSYTIASAIRHVQTKQAKPFDMIFCGKQAIDGDTAQVGPQIAEELGIPNVTYVCDIKLDTNEAGKPVTVVTREHDLGYEVVQATLPVLVTATLALNEPRVPTLWQSIYAKRYAIEHITVNDMEVDKERLGLGGSPTRVRKVYQPPLRAKVVMMDGSVADMATQVVNMARTVKGGATHE